MYTCMQILVYINTQTQTHTHIYNCVSMHVPIVAFRHAFGQLRHINGNIDRTRDQQWKENNIQMQHVGGPGEGPISDAHYSVGDTIQKRIRIMRGKPAS